MAKRTEKTRTVSVHFWNDAFIRKLNALDRYAFLYFLTNPHTNWCGIYELDISMAAFESGIDERDLEKSILPRLSPKIIFIEGWVYIKNWDEYHSSNLPGVKKGVEESLKSVPSEIRLKIEELLAYPLPIPCVTVTSASALAIASTLSTPEREILTDPKTGKKPTTASGWTRAKRVSLGKEPNMEKKEIPSELLELDLWIKDHRTMAERNGEDYTFLDDGDNKRMRGQIGKFIPKWYSIGKTREEFFTKLEVNEWAKTKGFNPFLVYTEAMMTSLLIGGKDKGGIIDIDN